jgi:hypothetical protein
MKKLRKRFLLRSLSVFLVLIIITNVMAPTISWAITLGPLQPEYTSYEEPGASDMVNMLTGDFTFSLPVLEVPGPEGSFSLPLTYNAGVGLDQEASWVGLGWTMNPGVITRSINQFPDDANGEAQVVTVQDLTGLRGWNASILGVGKFGWNNQVGHFGNLSILGLINASWTNDFTSVGLAGINVTSDGLKVDPVQMTMAAITLISWGAASGVGTVGSNGESLFSAVKLGKEIAKDAVIGVVADGIISGITGAGATPAASTDGYWAYSKTEKKNWGLKAITGFIVNVNEYKIWLDKTRTEDMYGTLYSGNAPTTNYSNSNFNLATLHNNSNANLSLQLNGQTATVKQYYVSSSTANAGAASDITYIPGFNQNTAHFGKINNPVTLAYDNFSVKAPGITGSIKPYRLDIGSVAMPREMSASHIRLAPLPYLSNTVGQPSYYKVPFIYNGQLSNSYFHHVGNATAVTTPSFYYGLSAVNTNGSGQGNLRMDLNDVIFGTNDRIKSTIPVSKKLPQSRYIEWLTQDEIRSATTYASRYMDFLNAGQRYNFRTDFPGSATTVVNTYTTNLGTTIPISPSDIGKFTPNTNIEIFVWAYNNATDYSNGNQMLYYEDYTVTVSSVNTNGNTITVSGLDSQLFSVFGKIAELQIRVAIASNQVLTSIGAFMINGPDGTAYHFGLPVYDYDNLTEIRQVSDYNKRSVIRRNTQYATAWLLTAITGPDFIDRNNNGVVDDTDWGSWVKLNYGRHLNNYEWRIPYTEYKKNTTGSHESFVSGKSHLYYLNSIETRSHIALFHKSLRFDGKSAKQGDVQLPLQLDEISLLSREHYNKLRASYGMVEYSNQVTQTLLTSSLSTPAKDYIKQNCDKRIVFTYAGSGSTSLCNGVPNSGGGKLTLTKVSIRGKNDQKTVPDYKFEYGNDPDYNIDKWDGFGMYSPNATATSHPVSQVDTDAAAWSLTKIINPLGSEIEINYERDDYASVSGDKIVGQGLSIANSDQGLKYYAPFDFPIRKLFINHNNFFSVGDKTRISAFTSYLCPGATYETQRNTNSGIDYEVTEVGYNFIKLDADFIGIDNCGAMNSGDFVEIKTQYGQISKVLTSVKGGDVRVGSIVTRDDMGVTRKIRYKYQNDDGSSSGVISKEPEYVGGHKSFYDYPEYPQTPVLYGKVSILAGNLSTDADHDSKQTYEFETPHYTMYQVNTNVISNEVELSSYTINDHPINGVNSTFKDRLSSYENKIEDRTSRVGRLKAVKIYDKNGNLYSSSNMVYNAQLSPHNEIKNGGVNNYQGIYSDGVIMFDRVRIGVLDSYLKLNRTTRIQYPSVLLKTTNYKDGFSSESTNLDWDFYTGNVLSKLERSPLGVYMKTNTRPAYVVYGELGPRALNETNKNMLSQVAMTESYRTTATGSPVGLVSAEVTTWNKTWSNYRVYNSVNQTYGDAGEGADVWRKGQSYVFKGNYARKNPDGTLSYLSSDNFNFAQVANNPLWQYGGEYERFDHYGMPLQNKDMNSIYSSTKMGYNESLQLASASNAKFTEIAFSSAEDLIPTTPYFGGEVSVGNGTVVKKSLAQVTEVHTGDAALSLSTGTGFVFKPTGVSLNRTYRASAWTNSVNGRLYYNLNGTEVQSQPPTEFVKIGPSQTNWYRIDLNIPIGATVTSLEVGVKSTSGTCLFDDFRFQPRDAALTGYVYHPITKQVEYVLDNDNVFSKYEYNDKGQVIKTYREMLKYNSVKLVTESAEDFKRFYQNQ